MADSNDLRQRRGKKSTVTSSATTSATTSSAIPLDQIRIAHARLVVSRDRTADLHRAWRGQLLRFAPLVWFVTMCQLKNSISSCVSEIKGRDSVKTITGMEASWIIFGDSYSELLAVVISTLLAHFLAVGDLKGKLELDGWSYMLSSALVPICVGLYYFNNSTHATCRGVEEEVSLDDDKMRHQFPAVILWHTMITGAYWFMKNGMRDCEDAVNTCVQTISELEIMDEKMVSRSKSNGGPTTKKK